MNIWSKKHKRNKVEQINRLYGKQNNQTNSMSNNLDEGSLRRAIEALSQSARRDLEGQVEAMRQQTGNMANVMPGGRFSGGIMSGSTNMYGPGFSGNMMNRRRLKLEWEGHEVFLQTDVPAEMPHEYVSRQFADMVYRVLRDFPRGWSSMGNRPVVENREVEQPERDEDDRLGAAFE